MLNSVQKSPLRVACPKCGKWQVTLVEVGKRRVCIVDSCKRSFLVHPSKCKIMNDVEQRFLN